MMGCKYLGWRGRGMPRTAMALVQSLVATAVLVSPAVQTLRGAEFSPLPGFEVPAPPPKPPEGQVNKPSRGPEFAPLPGFEVPAPPPKPAEGQVKMIPGLGQLQGIVIVPGKEGAKTPQELLSNIKPEGVSGVRGVVVKGPQFLRRHDFEALLSRHLGRPLSYAELSQVQVEIREYCQQHDHLVVDVFTSEQDIIEGTIQIAVIEGRLGKITVDNPGRHWFSDSVILRNVRLKPGDVVLESRLNADLNLLNRNSYQSLGYDGFSGSFHEVRANFHQGDLGQTDVKLEVQDRLPFRPFVGFEDSGLEVIGPNRLFAGFNWANAFGLDHRLNYEYVTDSDFNKFREHVASYVLPLPWRHELTLFGAYAEVDPDFSRISSSLSSLRNEGTFYQASLRYSVPLPPLGKYEHEVVAGFDFKRTDTPLLFGSGGAGSLLRTNNVDVLQFILGYSARHKDAHGTTVFSVQGVASPGDLTDQNDDSDFNDFRSGASSSYVYGRAEVRRETYLPYGFSWYTKASGQYSDSRLVATEIFSIGGYDTVRGYDERIVSGDHGWLVINELRTPPIRLGNLTRKPGATDWIQFLAFCDYGGAVVKHPDPQTERRQEVLLSVGAGFRYALADNFHVRFDYGFQLDREYLSAPNASGLGVQADQRAHFGLEVSY